MFIAQPNRTDKDENIKEIPIRSVRI